jgi:protoheme IX farnesyltransferase
VFVTAVESRPAGATAVPDGAPRTGALAKVRAYVALTKPRIIELLLVTTLPTMFLAEEGLPGFWLCVWVLVGGSLAAGSANTFNCYLDRDIDRVMHRTSRRPLVTGEVSERGALVFGFVLGIASCALLAATVNVLSSALALLAILLYVFMYTLGLKRRTASNIVWGGAAGCMPVLIGWSGVTNSLDWAPFVLFLVVFFWTPPHYWPLSLRFRDDYAAAGVPMLPVVADNVVVARRIVVYSWAMVLSSLALVPVAPTGPVYAVVAAVVGGLFLYEAHRLERGARAGIPEAELRPMRLFHHSITYLTVLFGAVMIDPFLF